MTMRMDTSGLSRAIPLAVARGRRTVAEQAVTSLGWIFVNAQKATPFVEVADIDAELAVIVRVANRNPKATRKGQEIHVNPEPWTEGMMIALQRTNPASPFSVATGNRWPLFYSGGLRGYTRYQFFQAAAARMQATRHSSTHFLKAGYSFAIKACFKNPLFQHSRKFRAANPGAGQNPNEINDLDPAKLGDFRIEGEGSGDMAVTGENNVGERSGNSVMDEKRRQALIGISGPLLQDAIDAEEKNLTERGELGVRMADALVDVQALLD